MSEKTILRRGPIGISKRAAIANPPTINTITECKVLLTHLRLAYSSRKSTDNSASTSGYIKTADGQTKKATAAMLPPSASVHLDDLPSCHRDIVYLSIQHDPKQKAKAQQSTRAPR